MQLLPKDERGWTPYAVLAYLAFFLFHPVLSPRPNWPATMAAIAVFLPLYFWCFWLTGRRSLRPSAGMPAIGALCAKASPGSSPFFLCAPCLIGAAAAPAVAFRYLGALLCVIALQAWLMDLP